MRWFRSHHGACFDSKLSVVARRANVTRGHAAAVWWAVLDCASQSSRRGFVDNLDPEEIAAAFDFEQDDVERIIQAMRDKELLISAEGKLTGWNKRQVTREDETASERKRAQREREAARDRADDERMSRNVTQCHAPDKIREDTDTDISPPCPPTGDCPPPLAEAVAEWNSLAAELGLPKCQKLTKARREQLRARLSDAGGLDGWRLALVKIRGSPGLLGRNDRGWRANIDFLLRESSFTKLMEGTYDNWTESLGGNGVHAGSAMSSKLLKEMGYSQ